MLKHDTDYQYKFSVSGGRSFIVVSTPTGVYVSIKGREGSFSWFETFRSELISDVQSFTKFSIIAMQNQLQLYRHWDIKTSINSSSMSSQHY